MADVRKGSNFDHRRFVVGLSRGIAGALLFALPMFLTMEMWELGFYIDRSRLFLLLSVNVPLLIVLAHRIGFERTSTWREAFRDAAIAYFLGILSSAAILVAIGVLRFGQAATEVAGTIALQAVPASIGALLARSQLGQRPHDEDEKCSPADTTYVGELFMMAVGALFLSLNVAPTEEMILLSYKMTPWHAIAVVLASIALMHGFVYALSFSGGHGMEKGTPGWHAFVRFTLPGYMVAFLVSVYCLWTFHRFDDVDLVEAAITAVVLGFPSAIGAASARLIL
ncbi:TIGR02587 family membrane protein [Mycoplana rhizolycopersici]|uniref:TIGR02587 family membrane protein n=1 Tax=Mycoplana rhizolycopersici TaxID=2746702 RepID=A0ABX2QKX8_9HYPH|nr:TIGR02587 family membrane protein [Rhizobium rhizolycopersici]NVP58335.1 TIGR02587 family membrane protein [Rhizobium rhizolycopersici]